MLTMQVLPSSATIEIFARLQHEPGFGNAWDCSATIEIFARLQLSGYLERD